MSAILYSFRRCPYAMRARMALHTADIENIEHREILLRDKPQAMLDVSPKGTVPVLVTETGEIIDESLELMRWALARKDPMNWLKADTQDTEDLIAENDGSFKFHLDRYKYASRYEDDAERGDTNSEHQQAAELTLAKLETRLTENAYLLGAKQSLADIALFPFIRQFANTNREGWEKNQFPNLREWLTRHVEADLFITIMAKHPVWTPAPS